MNVVVTRIAPVFPASVYVQWAFTPNPGVLGQFTFKVERSGSPDGPWSQVGQVLTNRVFTTDDTSVAEQDEGVNLQSLTRSLYYRVTVTAPNNTSATSGVVSLDGEVVGDTAQHDWPGAPQLGKRKFLLRKKILRDEELQLRVLNGVQLQVLKRRHFGSRCKVCYDKLTKMTTVSKCSSCYGTGWEGGFYPPIVTYGRFAASGINTALTNEGKSDVNQNNLTLLSYPRVEEGDVIVIPETDSRWTVSYVNPTSLRLLTVHQRVAVTEIPRSAVEYSVPA